MSTFSLFLDVFVHLLTMVGFIFIIKGRVLGWVFAAVGEGCWLIMGVLIRDLYWILPQAAYVVIFTAGAVLWNRHTTERTPRAAVE